MNITDLQTTMSYQFFLTLLSGIVISGVAGYLGTLMLSKKMSVVAGPLAHLAFPGVALALIFGFDISFGVFPFVILGAVFIFLLEEKTELPMENLAAIIFAIGVGTALLFLPIGKAEEALVGSITEITLGETIAVVVLGLLVFFTVRQVYQKIMLINVHEELAITEGVNKRIYTLLYVLSIAVVVSLGVFLVGGLITAALIAIPAATAKNITKGLRSYQIWATVFGIVSAVAGICIARVVHLPTGPMVIVSGAVLFLISIIFVKKRV